MTYVLSESKNNGTANSPSVRGPDWFPVCSQVPDVLADGQVPDLPEVHGPATGGRAASPGQLPRAEPD